MTIDEGGILKGGLSEYISGKLKEAAAKPVVYPRDKESERAFYNKYFQEIARQRALLQDIFTPIGQLFVRFNVLELLEELRRGYWAKESLIQYSYPSVSLVRNYEGLWNGSVPEVVRLSKYVPGGRDYSISTVNGIPTPARIEEITMKSGEVVPVSERRTMIVEAVKSEDARFEYDLLYSYLLRRVDLNNKRSGIRHFQLGFYYGESVPQDSEEYLTPKTRILANQSPETLKQMIGNQVLKELRGQ